MSWEHEKTLGRYWFQCNDHSLKSAIQCSTILWSPLYSEIKSDVSLGFIGFKLMKWVNLIYSSDRLWCRNCFWAFYIWISSSSHNIISCTLILYLVMRKSDNGWSNDEMVAKCSLYIQYISLGKVLDILESDYNSQRTTSRKVHVLSE